MITPPMAMIGALTVGENLSAQVTPKPHAYLR
jgi:hypothetical protein